VFWLDLRREWVCVFCVFYVFCFFCLFWVFCVCCAFGGLFVLRILCLQCLVGSKVFALFFFVLVWIKSFCFGLDQKFALCFFLVWFGSKVSVCLFCFGSKVFVLVWIKSLRFVFFFLFGSKVSVLFCFVCNQKCLCDLCFLCSLVSVDNGNERCLRVMRIDIAVECISSSGCVGSCPNCHRSTLYSGKGFLDRQYQYLPLAETLPQR
jgi:hypothetical protein